MMVSDWEDWAEFKGLTFKADYFFPVIAINGLEIDVLKQTYYGEEDEVTDQLRDFLRHYGVRIYTERGF